MTRVLSDALEAEIEQLSHALAKQVLMENTERDADAYQRLKDMRTLRGELAVPGNNTDRFMQVAVVILVAGLIAILSSLPITWFKSLTIEAEMFATRANFIVAELPAGQNEVLTPEIAVKKLELSVDGSSSVFPPQKLGDALRRELADAGALIASAIPQSPLTLDLPAVTSGTAITVQGSSPGYRIVFQGNNTPINYQLVLPPQSTVQLEYGGSRWALDTLTTVAFIDARRFDVDLLFAGGREALFSTPLPIDTLGFSSELRGSEQFPVSSIVSGSLHIPSVQRELVLRGGQRLHLDIVRGVVRTMQPTEDGVIHLTVAAEINELILDGRSEVPTVLAYLRSSVYFNMMWSSLLAVLGIVLTVVRWVGLPGRA